MVEENKKFRIDGNNVHMDYELDFVTAACGGIAYIETVHGVKEVKIEAGTQSGAEVRIFNAGLKSPYSKRMGDQVIKIKIKIPESLSSKQKLLLQKLCELEC
jgi:molecular chaperone DnaJ